MPAEYQVVDLFAGPGGLAEGFASVGRPDGSSPFRIALSIEKEKSAWQTLRLRAFLRQFPKSFPDEYYEHLNAGLPLPEWAELYPDEWRAAEREALCLELGDPESDALISKHVRKIRRGAQGNTILIGGPPCQAYSLVGRARNRGTTSYVPEADKRHFLYREYISILEQLQPAVFVMENVKGLISSSVSGQFIFQRILQDLRNAGGKDQYRLVPLGVSPDTQTDIEGHQTPADFVVRAEQFGIPQARHRVIIVGIRSDVSNVADLAGLSLDRSAWTGASVEDVLSGLPALRSGLSSGGDSNSAWQNAVNTEFEKLASLLSQEHGARSPIMKTLRTARAAFRKSGKALDRSAGDRAGFASTCPPELAAWLDDPKLEQTLNHDSRGHMASDLGRYLFCALFAQVNGRSPKAVDFPTALSPDHASWQTGKFEDRFRVQLSGSPASTVTSHISKDGHYFIHPDPAQCRSLTVREAARLQTFPDNYLFLGNRTQQYVQVGNAVPPLLANRIATNVFRMISTAGNRAKRSREAQHRKTG